jgi:hypothetical protein
MRPKTQCPSCSRMVRRRSADQRVPWHRNVTQGSRKWCIASPGYKGASPEAKARFVAAQGEAVRAEELTITLLMQQLKALDNEVQGFL